MSSPSGSIVGKLLGSNAGRDFAGFGFLLGAPSAML
jgi:hypothetical protein